MNQETLSQNQSETKPQTHLAQQLEPSVSTCDESTQEATCSPQVNYDDIVSVSQILDKIKITSYYESQDEEDPLEDSQDEEDSFENSQKQQQSTITATPFISPPQEVFQCCICEADIGENEEDYDLCSNNHHMCPDCIKSYVNVVLAEPQHKLPPKCASCYRSIPIQKLINILEGQQLEYLNNLLVIETVNTELLKLTEVQVLVACPFCPYVEIRDKNDVNFIFCNNPMCMKRSCFYCHLECPYKPCCSEDEDLDLKKHFNCYLIHEFKKEIEDAIESGMKVACPDCNTAGRKEADTCTHMTCIKCSSMYCYFCGESSRKCAGADLSNMNGHNNDWRFSSSKCPMHLNEIAEIDYRWPTNDEECLNFFHKMKILWNVREVCFKFGKDEVEEFEKSYGLLERSGINLKSILEEDIEFIIRYNNNNDDDEQEDEDEEE